MLWKITLGSLAVTILAVITLFWWNQRLTENLAAERFFTENLRQEVSHRERELDGLREDLRVTEEAISELRERAGFSDRIREAILANDTDVLNDIEGPVGEALRLLASLDLCPEKDVEAPRSDPPPE